MNLYLDKPHSQWWGTIFIFQAGRGGGYLTFAGVAYDKQKPRVLPYLFFSQVLRDLFFTL